MAADAQIARVFSEDDARVDPLYLDYRSTALRNPKRPLIILPHTDSEISGPAFGHETVGAGDFDLTAQHPGTPIGQRIEVGGRVIDGDGRPVPECLVEIWQANAAGRYIDFRDQSAFPVDPNFTGAGRTLTDRQGRYRFLTIKPGCYPWRNHHNAWRPAHIHFSVFGHAFATRLITQMYFPDDSLLDQDPIFHAVRDPHARQRLISALDWQTTVPEDHLGFRFDIVLRGRQATPMERS